MEQQLGSNEKIFLLSRGQLKPIRKKLLDEKNDSLIDSWGADSKISQEQADRLDAEILSYYFQGPDA